MSLAQESKFLAIVETWFNPYCWEHGIKLVNLMKKTHSCTVKEYSGLVVCECIDCRCEMQVTRTGVRATVATWPVFQYDVTVDEATIEEECKSYFFSDGRLLGMYPRIESYMCCRSRQTDADYTTVLTNLHNIAGML